MFRYRRYRVFLAFAFIAVFALYRFGSSTTSWREVASVAAGLNSEVENALHLDSKHHPAIAHETKTLKLDLPALKTPSSRQTPPSLQYRTSQLPHTPLAPTPQQKPTIPSPISPHPHNDPIAEEPVSPSLEIVHWAKLPEQFPVPTKSITGLPSSKPKSIPKIQYAFKPESAAAKTDRIAKLDQIRAVAQKSWNGYREFAWLHDEVRPSSGNYRDPFANWGATLVDALDTLWIMGLKEEFNEAVRAVGKIDFTTTSRADIPLFETTIRYLGGLLGAYDVSGNSHQILLDKAVELAEILISAFDTPNRMPETYYYWRPQFASQKHRASTRVVLAEIGSLSMEFTRLAQLTKESRYYDAIARITDHLEDFQNRTRLPGMWPTYLDASGCGKVPINTSPQIPLHPPVVPGADSSDTLKLSTSTSTSTEQLSPNGNKFMPLKLPDPVILTNDPAAPVDAEPEIPRPGKQSARRMAPALQKRQLDTDAFSVIEPPESSPGGAQPDAIRPLVPECSPQGFMSTSDYGLEEYTLGGMSDSTYEYLPKEYLLLGGKEEKYRTMYEQSIEVVSKHLVFRPMLPNEDDILFCGKLNVPSQVDDMKVGDLEGEYAHLTCFAGGMFGLGAKLFDRPADLEIAKKLTEGCVWSYNMTPSGIMPESFEVRPCEDTKECAWNETAYWETLDPRSEHRQRNYKDQMKIYESQLASASSWYEAQLAAMTATPAPAADSAFESQAETTPVYADTLDKRQSVDVGAKKVPAVPLPYVAMRHSDEPMPEGLAAEDYGLPTKTIPESEDLFNLEPSQTLPVFPYLYSPNVPLSHKEYVKSRIEEERLPKGVTKIGARNYILRPEAIESVWYMYRLTGDSHWREAGWQMFLAINEHTSTIYGNSAIDDVTKTSPELNDEMESFWLAETLKYFYLLFAEEDVISLDDWVLNTEAHPFRIPKK